MRIGVATLFSFVVGCAPSAMYSIRHADHSTVLARGSLGAGGDCHADVLAIPPSDPYDEIAYVQLVWGTDGTPLTTMAARAACAHGGDAFVLSDPHDLIGEVIRYRRPAVASSRQLATPRE